MHHDAVVHRGVRRDHERIGADGGARRRADVAVLAALELLDVRIAVQPSARCADRTRDTVEIAQRVDLRLPPEAQAPPGVELRERRPFGPLHGDAGTQRRITLALEELGLLAVREEEISVQPLEVALDPLGRDVALDQVDRRSVTLRGEARALRAMQMLELVIAVVDGGDEVCGRPTRLAATDRAVVDDHDALAFPRQKICRGQARDARAHDAHLRALAAAEWRRGDRRNGPHPW